MGWRERFQREIVILEAEAQNGERFGAVGQRTLRKDNYLKKYRKSTRKTTNFISTGALLHK